MEQSSGYQVQDSLTAIAHRVATIPTAKSA